MTPLTFTAYGVRGGDVTVIAERIVSWHQIDYNGNYGTEIELDTGKVVCVAAWPKDVEKAVEKAVAAMKRAMES